MANPGKNEAGASGSSEQQNKDATEGQSTAAAAEGDAAGKQRLEGKVDLALLNEDDDFEEFPAEEWDEVDPTTQTTKVSSKSTKHARLWNDFIKLKTGKVVTSL